MTAASPALVVSVSGIRDDRLLDARAFLRIERLRHDAYFADLITLEVELLEHEGLSDEADALLDRELGRTPNDEQLLYLRAMRAWEAGDPGAMERDLGRIIERNPDNAMALNALGYTLADMNMTERLDEARARTNPGQGYDGPGASISPRRNLPAGRHTIGVTPPADRQKGSPAIFGDHEIEGRWAPQPETTWWSVFGETKIDLTEADFPGERLVLDVQSSFSEVRVTVPRGTRVVVNATAILSEVKQRQDPDAEANGLTVVIDGVLIFGELKIRER